MRKSIVALLISAGVLTGCAQNNATESVAETVVETATAAIIGTATEQQRRWQKLQQKQRLPPR